MSQNYFQGLLQKLPDNDNAVRQVLSNPSSIGGLLQICEEIELNGTNKDLNNARRNAYVYEMLCYLLLNKLTLAKYFWKRVPAQLKSQDPELIAMWKIAQSMWKEEYANVYLNIWNGYKWNALFLPFLHLLEQEYRRRMIELLNKAYSSISYDELMNYIGYKNSGNKQQLNAWLEQLCNNYKINNWEIDDAKKIIVIHKQEENTQLNSELLTDLTNYVVFMESNQKLQFDEALNSGDNSKKNNK